MIAVQILVVKNIEERLKPLPLGRDIELCNKSLFAKTSQNKIYLSAKTSLFFP